MRLIKAWLTNKNVIICDDALLEMHKFTLPACSTGDLGDSALDVLQNILDKVQFLFSAILWMRPISIRAGHRTRIRLRLYILWPYTVQQRGLTGTVRVPAVSVPYTCRTSVYGHIIQPLRH
jgi:hypothetical protein